MDPALLKALGELLLNAVPTVILFLTLLFAYNRLVHKPMLRVLEQRHALTEGAVAKAQADIAAANAKTQEYEQRLREARAAMFKDLEQRRQRLLEARSQAVAQARRQADAKVNAAKAEIEKEASAARSTLQGQIEALAQRVIDQVLRAGAAGAAR